MNHLKEEEVLQRFKDKKVLHTIKSRKDKLVSHILCRNCLLRHVIAGKMEGRIEVIRI
jgi:hypothetical protein